MILKKLLICTMLITGSMSANASTHYTNLGTLDNKDFGLVSGLFTRAESFEDVINFTLNSTSTISGFITPFRVKSGGWSLSSSGGVLESGALSLGSYSFADFGDSRAFGFYSASYRVAVAAVPELETWLMLLIGAGLVAFQLHRKQKSLGQTVPDGPMTAA